MGYYANYDAESLKMAASSIRNELEMGLELAWAGNHDAAILAGDTRTLGVYGLAWIPTRLTLAERTAFVEIGQMPPGEEASAAFDAFLDAIVEREMASA